MREGQKERGEIERRERERKREGNTREAQTGTQVEKQVDKYKVRDRYAGRDR